MKQYEITVNGKVYQVSVKEVSGNEAPSPSPAVPQPTPQPAAPSPANSSAPVEGQNKIIAPMPGTILQVRVTEGQTVRKGEVLCILEAMKMENEIVAPIDGTVSSIHIAPNQAVNSGDLFMLIN